MSLSPSVLSHPDPLAGEVKALAGLSHPVPFAGDADALDGLSHPVEFPADGEAVALEGLSHADSSDLSDSFS